MVSVQWKFQVSAIVFNWISQIQLKLIEYKINRCGANIDGLKNDLKLDKMYSQKLILKLMIASGVF